MTNEYEAAHEACALFDMSAATKIELKGPEARIFLHNLSSNDIKSLTPGQGCEAFLCTTKARVVGLVWVSMQLDGSLMLDTVPGQGEKLCQHLDHYLISEQVEILDRSADFALFRLIGPTAALVVESAFGKLPTDFKPLASSSNPSFCIRLIV